MFSKTHGITVLDLSVTYDMSHVWTGRVHLECASSKALNESIAQISLNQFKTYWEITLDGSVLLS